MVCSAQTRRHQSGQCCHRKAVSLLNAIICTVRSRMSRRWCTAKLRRLPNRPALRASDTASSTYFVTSRLNLFELIYFVSLTPLIILALSLSHMPIFYFYVFCEYSLRAINSLSPRINLLLLVFLAMLNRFICEAKRSCLSRSKSL